MCRNLIVEERHNASYCSWDAEEHNLIAECGIYLTETEMQE